MALGKHKLTFCFQLFSFSRDMKRLRIQQTTKTRADKHLFFFFFFLLLSCIARAAQCSSTTRNAVWSMVANGATALAVTSSRTLCAPSPMPPTLSDPSSLVDSSVCKKKKSVHFCVLKKRIEKDLIIDANSLMRGRSRFCCRCVVRVGARHGDGMFTSQDEFVGQWQMIRPHTAREQHFIKDVLRLWCRVHAID